MLQPDQVESSLSNVFRLLSMLEHFFRPKLMLHVYELTLFIKTFNVKSCSYNHNCKVIRMKKNICKGEI